MRPSIRHLRMFQALARSNSVTLAAEMCHVSQPAVTQAIAKLSEDTGQRLFRRNAQGSFLTDAGGVLARRTDRALNFLDTAMADMARTIRVQATWAQLGALIAVVELGNFTLAARRLDLAQPTVHRSTSALERAAGAAFFQRTPHGLIATRAAQNLALAARLALAELDQAASDLAALGGREVGRIVVGALPLSRSGWLPKAILRFRDRRPSFPVEVLDGRYDELLLSLRRGEIDMMLGALRLPAPIEDIEQQAVFDDEVVLVVRHGHPLLQRVSITPRMLVEYPWVLPRNPTPIRAQLDAFLAAKPPRSVTVASSVIVMRQILCASDHIGCLSRVQAEPRAEAEVLAILPVELPQSARPIGITTRKNWEPSRAQQEFLDAIHAAAPRKG